MPAPLVVLEEDDGLDRGEPTLAARRRVGLDAEGVSSVSVIARTAWSAGRRACRPQWAVLSLIALPSVVVVARAVALAGRTCLVDVVAVPGCDQDQPDARAQTAPHRVRLLARRDVVLHDLLGDVGVGLESVQTTTLRRTGMSAPDPLGQGHDFAGDADVLALQVFALACRSLVPFLDGWHDGWLIPFHGVNAGPPEYGELQGPCDFVTPRSGCPRTRRPRSRCDASPPLLHRSR